MLLYHVAHSFATYLQDRLFTCVKILYFRSSGAPTHCDYIYLYRLNTHAPLLHFMKGFLPHHATLKCADRDFCFAIDQRRLIGHTVPSSYTSFRLTQGAYELLPRFHALFRWRENIDTLYTQLHMQNDTYVVNFHLQRILFAESNTDTAIYGFAKYALYWPQLTYYITTIPRTHWEKFPKPIWRYFLR